MQNFHYKTSQFNLKPASSNENYLIFDIETNGLYDEATELFCVAIHDVVRDETIGYGPESIDRAISRLASATCLIGHNIIFYDLPVLKKLLNFETHSTCHRHARLHQAHLAQRKITRSRFKSLRRCAA